MVHHLAQDADARGVAPAPPPPLFDLEQTWQRLPSGSDLTGLHVRFDRLGGLKRIFLEHSCVQGLSALADLRSLEWLNIRDTEVSDLGPLMMIENLQHLDVLRSKVPPHQVERLCGAISGLEIDPF